VSQPWFLTGDPREKTPLITSVFRYGGLTFAALCRPDRLLRVNHGGLTPAALCRPDRLLRDKPRRADVRRSWLCIR
jgi:hypothetical protein